MTDTQADLTERARALAEELWWVLAPGGELKGLAINDAAAFIVAFAQSEREAALMDGGEWRTKLAKQIGKTQAAAAESRRLRDALELFVAFGCPVCRGDCASANPPVALCPMQAAERALASPAPQEETR